MRGILIFLLGNSMGQAFDDKHEEIVLCEGEVDSSDEETKDEPTEDEIASTLELVTFENLPDEIWLEFLSYLNFRELLGLRTVNKLFYRLLQDDKLLGDTRVWYLYENLIDYLVKKEKGEDVNYLRECWVIIQYNPLRDDAQLRRFWFNRAASLGFDVNALSCCRRPLLAQALYVGCLEFAEVLLAHGANVNGRSSAGSTALHTAVREDNVKFVSLLLKYKADINAKNDHNETALNVAAERLNPEVVRILLSNGADPNIRDDAICTPLDVAFWRVSISSYRRRPLTSETITRFVETVRLLFAYGGSFENINKNFWLTLIADDSCGEIANAFNALIVSVLLEYGADVDFADKFGNTALHLAIHCRYLSVVRVLLLNGADPNICNRDGYSCLNSAVLHYDLAGVEELLRVLVLETQVPLTEITLNQALVRARENNRENIVGPIHEVLDQLEAERLKTRRYVVLLFIFAVTMIHASCSVL